LAARVSVYRSDSLDDIPSSEQWNLVVGNPPHFVDELHNRLRYHDADWNIHRRFFAKVEDFLAPDGVIVLQENNHGSTAETFRPMIEESGLAIRFVHGAAPQRAPDGRKYYIGIMRRDDEPPDWVRRLAR